VHAARLLPRPCSNGSCVSFRLAACMLSPLTEYSVRVSGYAMHTSILYINFVPWAVVHPAGVVGINRKSAETERPVSRDASSWLLVPVGIVLAPDRSRTRKPRSYRPGPPFVN
jgi:hypothetical protein